MQIVRRAVRGKVQAADQNHQKDASFHCLNPDRGYVDGRESAASWSMRSAPSGSLRSSKEGQRATRPRLPDGADRIDENGLLCSLARAAQSSRATDGRATTWSARTSSSRPGLACATSCAASQGSFHRMGSTPNRQGPYRKDPRRRRRGTRDSRQRARSSSRSLGAACDEKGARVHYSSELPCPVFRYRVWVAESRLCQLVFI